MMQKQRQLITKPVGQWRIFLAAATALPTGAVFLYSLGQFHSTSQSPAPDTPTNAPAISAVTGLGRLEPQGEVIHLSAPTSLEGARVAQLLVKEGDKVRAGQVVALLDAYQPRLATLNQAKQQVKVAQARLAKVKAGAPAGEIAASEAALARLSAELRGEVATFKATSAGLEAELSNAQSEFKRYQELYQDGAISASLFDSKRLAVETVREQLNEAKATLKRTVESYDEQIGAAKATLSAKAEVRFVDVQVAQTEVESAIATVKQAQAELTLAYVHAPIDSQILKIHTRPGEIISNQGIAELGQTDQMYTIAQIYETDIAKVRPGQRVTVTGGAFSGKLQGTVTDVGLQVSRQDVFNNNPLADTDHKVVEVKIRLDDLASQRVAGLTNLQVQAFIHIGSTSQNSAQNPAPAILTSTQNPEPAILTSAPAISAVTGLGRLEPQGEVIHLSASTSLEGARVAQLLVKEGDKVQAGQVVALLDAYQPRLATLNQAKQQVKVAQARLAKVKAGTPTGEIAASEAALARLSAELRGEVATFKATSAGLEAELSNAQSEFKRYQELYQDGAISASLFDSKRLAVETFREQLNEAKATLKRTVESYDEQISAAKATLSAKAEVRFVDVQVAQTEVESAIATVKQAQAELTLAYVHAPIDSQILKIHTRPGEIISNQGIAELGQTDQMYTIAQIYETDIAKVRPGQQVTVTSEAFSGKLQGTVTDVGLQVSKQDIFNSNPLADTDHKVVEVKIRLNDLASQRVAGLTNLQVQAFIHT